jgi:hypothetical protein
VSNHLALASVTAVLCSALQDAVDSATPTFDGKVTSQRPNAPSPSLPNPGINVFLYQVTPSTSLRNSDLPRTREDGTIAQRPVAALELSYLISFHGDDAKLEPQILQGIAVQALHEQPALTRATIQRALSDNLYQFLRKSDLAEAFEIPRLAPIVLSLEELSKLWSVMLQTSYVPSLAYRASVVLIDGRAGPDVRLPVRAPRVAVSLSSGPSLERLLPDGPILPNSTLTLLGRNLLGSVTRVRFGDLEATPDPSSVATRLQLLVLEGLPAGLHGVQVVHRARNDSAFEAASSVLPFVLSPEIRVELAGAAVRVTFTSAVTQTQRVYLLLNELPTSEGAPRRAFTFKAPAREDPLPVKTLEFKLPDVPAGQYLVRAQVDGAESQLTFDETAARYSGPLLTIP